MKRFFFFIHCFIVLTCLLVHAQDNANQNGVPRFEIATQPEAVEAGQPFQLLIKVIYNSNINIKPKTLPIDLTPFTIQDATKLEHLDYNADEPTQVDPSSHIGLLYDAYQFTLTINEPGVQQIPAVPFEYQISNGQIAEISTEPYPIAIEGAAVDDELRDIKAPMELEGKSYVWVLIVVILLIIAAIIAAFYFWKRMKKEPEIAPPPPVPAHIKALEALKKVRENETLFREGRLEELTIQVSEIVRVYLYDRYGILAMDYTTEEIITALKGRRTPFETHKAFRDFFEECDLIKFAKHELAGEAMLNLVEIAEELVIKTQEKDSEVNDQAVTTS